MSATPHTPFEVAHRHSSGLPDDLLESARNRLRWACLIYAGAYFSAYWVPRLTFFDNPLGLDYTVEHVTSLTSIGLALVLALALSWRRLPTRPLLNAGLVFEVVGAIGIAFAEYRGFYTPRYVEMNQIYIHGVSWVGVWIVAFPTLVPAPFGRTLVAILACVATGPVMLITSWEVHQPALDIAQHHHNLFDLSIANGVAGAMALTCSRIVHRLSRDVGEARQVGSYHLVELMGKGGMGEVWRARHRLLVRPAAVKLIRRDALVSLPGTTPDRVLRRFEREAQATAQLACPHSVQLYDFGTTRDGSFFYVMELLNGLDVETLVQRYGPQPAERVVCLVRQVCESLEEAHQRGLLHRDIKPANLFVCRQGLELDFVKVLDFGLVKTFGDSERASDTKLTAEGTVTGTPAFMAPEALLGDEADARSDLYALGCVTYWLLTGRMVFDAPSPMKLALMHVDRTPTPPSSVSELPIPPELDRLVLDLLAKRPEDRPFSAAQVMARLDALPLATRWTQARAHAWWQSHLPERLATGSTPALTATDLASVRVHEPG